MAALGNLAILCFCFGFWAGRVEGGKSIPGAPLGCVLCVCVLTCGHILEPRVPGFQPPPAHGTCIYVCTPNILCRLR